MLGAKLTLYNIQNEIMIFNSQFSLNTQIHRTSMHLHNPRSSMPTQDAVPNLNSTILLSALDQKTSPIHLLRLGQAHRLQNRRRHIPQFTVLLLQAPSFGCVCHDEGDFIRCVRCLWLAFFVEHFFCVAGDVCVSIQLNKRVRDLIISSL